jgi:4-amino-4-deoxy-L-arabinose transferase-like glycosyltransferase
MSWKKLAWLVVILLLAAFTLAYASPFFSKTSDIDSAIFQYIGNGIRSGQLPYRDLYDHKPPAIFYLNALGLTLGGGSRWGIWIIELFSLTLAGIFCASYLKRFFGTVPAMIATAAFLLNLTFFHEEGNLTEEYALPFEFGALYLLSLWSSAKRPNLLAFLMGISIAFATSFKQPLGALAVSIMIYIFISSVAKKDVSRFLKTLAWFTIGFTTLWMLWFAFFFLNQSFSQFWEAAFSYNFSLASIPITTRFLSLQSALQTLLTTSPYYLFALLSWGAALLFMLIKNGKVQDGLSSRWLGWLFIGLGFYVTYKNIFISGLLLIPAQYFGPHHMVRIIIGILTVMFGVYWLSSNLSDSIRFFFQNQHTNEDSLLFLPLLIALIDFPVQLIMISLSGFNFGHYYMSLLPSATVLCAFLFWSLFSNSNRVQALIWTSALAIPIIWFGVSAIMKKTHFNEDKTIKAVAAYVQSVTQPGDPVFFWSNTAPLYLESERFSPSIYFFTDPLFLRGYTNRQQTGPFLEQLQASPPKMLVVAPNPYHPFVYLGDATQCSQLSDMDYALQTANNQYHTKNIIIPEGMPDVYAWICANYTLNEIELPGIDLWNNQLYRYTPSR